MGVGVGLAGPFALDEMQNVIAHMHMHIAPGEAGKSKPSPSPPPLPTEPLPFLVTNVEHDGVRWVWGRTEASGDAQSGTVGTWRRIPGVTFH